MEAFYHKAPAEARNAPSPADTASENQTKSVRMTPVLCWSEKRQHARDRRLRPARQPLPCANRAGAVRCGKSFPSRSCFPIRASISFRPAGLNARLLIRRFMPPGCFRLIASAGSHAVPRPLPLALGQLSVRVGKPFGLALPGSVSFALGLLPADGSQGYIACPAAPDLYVFPVGACPAAASFGRPSFKHPVFLTKSVAPALKK